LKFLLAIEVTAYMKSLKIRILSWLDLNTNYIALRMANISAVNNFKNELDCRKHFVRNV